MPWRWRLGLLLCAASGLALAAADARRDEVEQQLAALRRQLAQVAEEQRRVEGERRAEVEALAGLDRAIQAARIELDAADAGLARQQAALAALEQERDALQRGLERERAALRGLVRAWHLGGRDQPLRELLAPDHLDQLLRRRAYLGYLREHRQARARELLDSLRRLAEAERALREQEAAVAEARARQAQAVERLERARAERAQALAAIEHRHASLRERAALLGRDEQRLAALLRSLQDVLADVPENPPQAQPLARRKGQLPRPLPGRLHSAFAGTLPDGRPSKGWWIEARPGAEVRAVARGRVAFADWMRGYGLLLILDHGEGYMSLYAGGDALLAEPGEWVEAGQVVARAGDSGGFSRSGVYFELRRNGQALDPAAWLAR